MCRKKSRKFFLLILAGAMILLPAAQVAAFEPVTWGDQELTVYGFLRNNLGLFTEEHSYVRDGNDLATARTWLRVYGDLKLSENMRFWAAIQYVYEPEYDIEEGSVSEENGKEYSEYDSINDVLRECYLDWQLTGKHSLRIGRQIVIWGESMTTRVGDVIHPDDTRFTFAFANLEDTRIPLWMVKGNSDFDSFGVSLEWLVAANIQKDEYRVNRTAEFGIPAIGEVGQRFGLYPEDRGAGMPPISRSFFELFPGVWVPFEIPHIVHEYPQNSLGDARFGFRTSTFLEGYEFGVLYFHTQNYDPLTKRGGLTLPPFPGPPPTREYKLVHPDIDIIGAYTNKDLPLGLFRGEAIYVPNKPFNTFDMTEQDAIVDKDYVKYMVAWDLNGYFYYDWHKSAPIDITLEHVGEWIPDSDDLQYVIYQTERDSWTPSFNGRISTNWFYNKLSTEIIASFAPRDNSGLLMPIVKYMPAWRNKSLSIECRYIRIFGDDNYEGLGMLQEKDMVVLTTQFNF